MPFEFDSEQFRAREPNRNQLALLFKELEFRQLQQTFPIETDLSKKSYNAILDLEGLEKLISDLKQTGRFALADFKRERAFSLSIVKRGLASCSSLFIIQGFMFY